MPKGNAVVDPSELVSKLSDRGDLGVALISYVIGYCLDFWVFPSGISSGVVAALSAAGAVGVKSLSQAVFEFVRRDFQGNVDRLVLIERVARLADFVDEFLKAVHVEKDHPMSRIQREITEREFLWRSGLMTDREFNQFLGRVVSVSRRWTERYLYERLEDPNQR